MCGQSIDLSVTCGYLWLYLWHGDPAWPLTVPQVAQVAQLFATLNNFVL